MADPFSIVASALTVLQIGAICANSFLSIIEGVRDAPEELIAILNEINRLNAIKDEVRKVPASLAAVGSSTPQSIATLRELCEEADDALRDLNTLALKFNSNPQKLNRAVSWLCKKTRAEKYLTRLRNIRENMVALLAAEHMSVF